jgi:hypothetical protein
MIITVNQQYGYQCTEGATSLLSFQINDLVFFAEAESGKAANAGGNLAACFSPVSGIPA